MHTQREPANALSVLSRSKEIIPSVALMKPESIQALSLQLSDSELEKVTTQTCPSIIKKVASRVLESKMKIGAALHICKALNLERKNHTQSI